MQTLFDYELSLDCNENKIIFITNVNNMLLNPLKTTMISMRSMYHKKKKTR